MPIFSLEGIFPNNLSAYTSQQSTKRKDSEGTDDQSRTRSKQGDNSGNEPGKTNELTTSEKQQEASGANALAPNNRQTHFYTSTSQPPATPGNSIDLFV